MSFGRRTAQLPVSNAWTSLAPVGGINDADPLASMEPQFAIMLRNWFPGNSALVSRVGYREWVTGLTLPVKTLMPYYNMAGQAELFAATDGGIYDVTVSSDAPAPVHPSTNGYYKHTMFGNVGNQYLIAVNGGTDPSVLYDGTSWVDFIQTGAPAAPGEIDGVNPDTFSHVTTFKNRLWFVQQDTATAWYLPVDSTSGTASPFYLTSLFRRGGKLLAIIGWSYDGGHGLDDKMVFISDVGEVVVYGGSDPDDSTTWALQAILYISQPLGDKSFNEVGGDVMITTKYGIVSLNRTLVNAEASVQNEGSISKRINRTINQLIEAGLYGRQWELHNLQPMQALAVVIPKSGENRAIQYVMNLLTGAWSQYDLPARTMAISQDSIYFGTEDGRVCTHTPYSYIDNVARDGTGGVPIECEVFSAFSYMDDTTHLKHWKLVRPIFQASRAPHYLLRLNTDFNVLGLAGAPAPIPPELFGPSLWDEAIWDESTWVSRDAVFRPWVGVAAIGFCAALRMKVSTTTRVAFTAIEYVFETGGIV